MPCSSVKVNRRLEGTHRQHIQGFITFRYLFHDAFLIRIFFDTDYGDDIFLRNVGLLSPEILGVTFQDTTLQGMGNSNSCI
jgi:hypothetical protein